MHEMALHGEAKDDSAKPPFNADYIRDRMLNSGALTSAHIDALSSCVTAVTSIFEAFLNMDIFSARCLPVFNFVRIAYGVVVLIKIYFSSAAPDSELGKVIPKDQIKVEYYLERLLAKFKATASNENSRPATKFLVILVMLRSWFIKYTGQMKENHRRQTPATGDSERTRSTSSHTPLPSLPGPDLSLGPGPSRSSGQSGASILPEYDSLRPSQPEHHQQQQQQHPIHAASMAGGYPSANTPLHVLSEIATGDPSLMGSSTPQVSWRNSFPPPNYLYETQPAVGSSKGPNPGPLVAARVPTVVPPPVVPQNISVAGTANPAAAMPWIDPYGPDAMGVNVPVDFNLIDFTEVPPESFDWEGLTMSLGAGLPSMYDVVPRQNGVGDEGRWFGSMDDAQGLYP
jgi:hypothetical protein